MIGGRGVESSQFKLIERKNRRGQREESLSAQIIRERGGDPVPDSLGKWDESELSSASLPGLGGIIYTNKTLCAPTCREVACGS